MDRVFAGHSPNKMPVRLVESRKNISKGRMIVVCDDGSNEIRFDLYIYIYV